MWKIKNWLLGSIFLQQDSWKIPDRRSGPSGSFADLPTNESQQGSPAAHNSHGCLEAAEVFTPHYFPSYSDALSSAWLQEDLLIKVSSATAQLHRAKSKATWAWPLYPIFSFAEVKSFLTDS